MKISTKIQTALINLQNEDEYWFEELKLDFVMSLEKQRRISGISYADLAKKIQKSPAYISKVFRGDTNLTIESMVKLARAVGANLSIELVDQAISSKIWANCIQIKNNVSPTNRQYSNANTVITNSKFCEMAA